METTPETLFPHFVTISSNKVWAVIPFNYLYSYRPKKIFLFLNHEQSVSAVFRVFDIFSIDVIFRTLLRMYLLILLSENIVFQY